LQHFPLLSIFDLTLDDIVSIEGFAKKTGEAVIANLAKIKNDFLRIHALGFNLIRTPLRSEQAQAMSPIAGKTIVFTGTMTRGSREDMTRDAKRLGAKVASSVSGKTDFLVTGDDVGVAKINAAKEKGVKVITEADYLAMLV
jgi:DNA ligase (NAD+)